MDAGARTPDSDSTLTGWAAEAIALAEACGLFASGQPEDFQLALLYAGLMQARQAFAMAVLTAEALDQARQAGRAEGRDEGYTEGHADGYRKGHEDALAGPAEDVPQLRLVGSAVPAPRRRTAARPRAAASRS